MVSVFPLDWEKISATPAYPKIFFVDTVSTTIMKQHNPGLTDPQLRQLIAAHIDDDSFW